jgi:hypothetical protein
MRVPTTNLCARRQAFRFTIAQSNSRMTEGRVNQYGRPWNRNTISHILSNEKYVGHNVYNRTSCKLKSKLVKNPPEMWIRSINAFEAVVEPELFLAVRGKMEEITNRKSNQHMLDNLRSLLLSKGRLTGKLINEAEALPCAGTYLQRFGSLMKAYELIGYEPKNKSSIYEPLISPTGQVQIWGDRRKSAGRCEAEPVRAALNQLIVLVCDEECVLSYRCSVVLDPFFFDTNCPGAVVTQVGRLHFRRSAGIGEK